MHGKGVMKWPDGINNKINKGRLYEGDYNNG